MKDLKIEDFKGKPPEYSCKKIPFKYGRSCHVITGYSSIIENESLLKVLPKNSKYREPRTMKWNIKFKFYWFTVGVSKSCDVFNFEMYESRSKSMSGDATLVFLRPRCSKIIVSCTWKVHGLPAENDIVFVCKMYFI